MYSKGDFHIHSNNSDGKLTVFELADSYKKSGYDIIALTDHDTVAGCEKIVEYGKKIGLKVIPGIEISTKYRGEDIHILGYFNDGDYKRKEIQEFGEMKLRDRSERCNKMCKALKLHFNVEIDADKLLRETKGMIGRPHMARAIIEAGYCKDMQEVFNSYLSDDSPAYIPSSSLSPQEGIDLLRRNNAVIVFAHPVLMKNSQVEDVLNTFRFDGIEAIYGMNTEEDTIKYLLLAKKYNLLVTAGSDFHEFNFNNHSNIGDISLGSTNIIQLLSYIGSK